MIRIAVSNALQQYSRILKGKEVIMLMDIRFNRFPGSPNMFPLYSNSPDTRNFVWDFYVQKKTVSGFYYCRCEQLIYN
jgi:hypothetical protein